MTKTAVYIILKTDIKPKGPTTMTNAIVNRRSIRKYTDKAVSEEQVKELLTAASLAPSWTNSQPSRYYVAMGEARDKVADMLP